MFTLLVALLLSVALALLGHRSARERLCVAAYVFAACVFTTIAGSWAMFLIHG
jgi:hypothetical protein